MFQKVGMQFSESQIHNSILCVVGHHLHLALFGYALACCGSNVCLWKEISLPTDDALSLLSQTEAQTVPNKSLIDSNQDFLGAMVAS